MSDSFTDQKQRIVTEEDFHYPRLGSPNSFRCHLCGHKFEVGDRWRWVSASHKGLLNFLVCGSCDTDNVLDKWVDLNKELKEMKDKFWWYFNEEYKL